MQDFSRQVAIAIRWLPLILVFAIAAGGLAYVYASSRPVMLEAVGTLRVNPGRAATVQDRQDAVLAALGYASDLTTPGYARVVIRELQLDETPAGLLDSVRVDADGDADVALIEVGVQSTDPEKAQAIVRAFGDQLIAQKTQQLVTADVRRATEEVRRLEGDLEGLRRTLSNLRSKPNKDELDRERMDGLPLAIASLAQQISSMRAETRSYVRNLPSWIVQPRLPTDSVAAGPLYWTILALLAGGMLGVAAAFVLEYLRRANKVRDVRDLELATGLPTLGSILEPGSDRGRADGERLVMIRYPRSDGAEAYRDVVARIGFSGGSARSLVITSAKPTDANGLVAANIALAYAEAGRNVILVDADYRAPRVHSYFGVTNDRGLTTILTDSGVPLGFATVPTVHPRLGLMPSGPLPRETAEPLGARQLNALLRRLLQAADLVIVHSPAMQGRLDAAVLAEQLDAVLLVVPYGSKADETEEATRSIQQAEAEFVGAVLYRTVRRTRKGVRVEVAPAPAGWGPTWPGLYDAPPQLPAVSQAERHVQPPHPASMPATAPTQATKPTFGASGQVPVMPASGPYAVPFRPDGGTPQGSSGPAQQAAPAAPVGQAPPSPPTVAPVAAAPPPPAAGHAPAVPSSGRLLRAMGPGVAGDAKAGPDGATPPAALPFSGTFQAAPLFRPAQAAPPPGPAPAVGPLAPLSPGASAAGPSRNGGTPLPGPAASPPASVPAAPSVAVPASSDGSGA